MLYRTHSRFQKHFHGVIFLRVQSQGVLRKNQRVNALNPPGDHLGGENIFGLLPVFMVHHILELGLRINGIRLDVNFDRFFCKWADSLALHY